MMKRLLKQGLLRFGGYALAQNLYSKIEYKKLIKNIRIFLDTGNIPLPDMVMFEPTMRCNLHCKMCYQKRDMHAGCKELSTEQIAGFFDRNPRLKKVNFIGGEIFVRPDILDIIRNLGHTRDIVISTNGTLIGDSEIDELGKCRNIFTIRVSLDGPKEVHEKIRRVHGSYDKTVIAIEALAAVFPVTVTCVILNDNVMVLPDVVDLCAAIGVKKVNFEFERIYSEKAIAKTKDCMGIGSTDIKVSSDGCEREYSTGILLGKLEECQARGRKAGIYVTVTPAFLKDEVESCYSGSLRAKARYYCQWFRTATIAPNGDLIHCMILRKSYGNILDEPFDILWNSETANNFRRQLIKNNLTPLCENCPFMTPYRGTGEEY
jgi:radical SAM protein with 4Fe4S-binding SPASM domain